MYYSTIEEDDGNNMCSGEHRKDITNQLPLDSDKLLSEKKEVFPALNTKKYGRGRKMNLVHSDQFLN